MLAVDIEGGKRVLGHEVVSEGERQSEPGGKAGAEVTGAKQPDRWRVAGAWDSGDVGERPCEVGEQLGELLGEVVGGWVGGASERVGCDLVGAGGAPDTEVYSSRMQGLEHSELLCDHQGLVVGKHDSARTDAERRRRTGEVRDQDRRRRAGDAGHVVMFRDPVAQVAEPLNVPSQVERVSQRLSNRRTTRDRREIEHR